MLKGGWGGVGVEDYLHAHIHLRFRYAHHETKDLLSGVGYRGSYIQFPCYMSSSYSEQGVLQWFTSHITCGLLRLIAVIQEV